LRGADQDEETDDELIEVQIIAVLKAQEAGTPRADACRMHWGSLATACTVRAIVAAIAV